MTRFCVLLLLLYLTACDFDGPHNSIPFRYDLSCLHDTLKAYGVWTHRAAPLGFRSKSSYDPTGVDSTSWTISIGIDSANNCFFDERFVSMLARKVFDNPANAYFRHITFELKQHIRPAGTAVLIYSIDRETDTIGLRQIPASDNARIVEVGTEGVGSAGKYGNWKTMSLTIDSVPREPLSIAYSYWLAHRQYPDIDVQVRHIASRLCKEVRYQFWFGNGKEQ